MFVVAEGMVGTPKLMHLVVKSACRRSEFFRLPACSREGFTDPDQQTQGDFPVPIRSNGQSIDDSDGDCDTPGDKEYKAWSRETPLLKIEPGDVISDDGHEIYNVLRQHGINTVLMMGVHANMCILNRSFGIRQLTKWGVRCILVRDLADAMYNPASPPHVSHAAGTELVIEHIEKYWAPSVLSNDLIEQLQIGS